MNWTALALILVALALVAIIAALALLWYRHHRRRERFTAASTYAEDVTALPSGVVMYLSAFSDPSVASAGTWTDLSPLSHSFAFAAPPPLSLTSGERGYDLAGISATGPQAVDLLPAAGQDFTLAWAARDPAQAAAATLFQLRANTTSNNGLLVSVGPGPAGMVTLAAAVGSGSAGTWTYPATPDTLAVFALVKHGPAVSVFRNGARMEPTLAPGPADEGMLFSNPPAALNPGGAWTGRMAAVGLWGRALQDLEVGAVTAHVKAEAGDLPRVRTEAAQAQAQVQAQVQTHMEALDAQAKAQAQDAAARAAIDRASSVASDDDPESQLRLRTTERFTDLAHSQVMEAARDAIALVNGGATVAVRSASA